MQIFKTPTLSSSAIASTATPAKTNHSSSFNDLLAGSLDEVKQQQQQTGPAKPIISIGVITSETQTVSELLMQHKDLKKSTWDILSKEQNKNRDYTRIPAGTRIYYNSKEGTLTWSATSNAPSPPKQARASIHSSPFLTGASVQNSKKDSKTGKTGSAFSQSAAVAPATINGKGLDPIGELPLSSGSESTIKVGSLNGTNTTVSHLLINHPQLRKDTWSLLSSSVNKDKPFHRLASGTEIYLNTKNMELTWHTAKTITSVSSPVDLAASETLHLKPAAPQQKIPAANLSEAVQSYLGTPYKELNCYELLVKGLEHMDIAYKGRDGLYTKLTRMAKERGMAANAYLTGEGIIEAAGTLVMSKKFPNQANWKDQAATLAREMEPILSKGQILSFSTNTRGHTGIVSQQDKQWTYINSGRLDNSMKSNSVYRGVGEEVLHKEIRNWFKLAHTRNETLNVTLGHLEQEPILTASAISESPFKPI